MITITKFPFHGQSCYPRKQEVCLHAWLSNKAQPTTHDSSIGEKWGQPRIHAYQREFLPLRKSRYRD